MSLLPLVLVTMLWPMVAASDSEVTSNNSAALEDHLEQHPEAEATDVYKFLHQSVFGPGHAIPNPDAAARYLAHEITELGPARVDELPCEKLGGEPVLMRVNLRPFLDAGGDESALLDAFVAAANQVHGDQEHMQAAIAEAIAVLEETECADLARDLRALSVDLAPEGYPAIHHSERYREAYAPAYRVVTLAAAADHGWCE